MSRGATYGYDQRFELFGSKGRLQVGNIPETSLVVSNSQGVTGSKYLHSFPQRFHQAFGNELDAFVDTLVNGTPWSVTREECIRVQRVADAAQESARTGTVVGIDEDDTC